MDMRQLALKDVPADLVREITRYGGLNPFGAPLWRVVLAQNVREQCFGTMRHMPTVSADLSMEELAEIEPERFTSGEMWVSRYVGEGWCLERWFPASTWGDQSTWEHETAQDGSTRLKGEWPRHGDYFMVNDEFYVEPKSADFWKQEIQRWMRSQDSLTGTEAARLSRSLYLNRVREERRREDYLEEVNQIHRATVDPMLATIGTTAQRMRDGLAEEMGWNQHVPVG